jgi:hypothetical protein
MAFMQCISPCLVCRNAFSYNPELVPSLRVNGVRQPICRDCIELANKMRVERGLNPHPVLPGAYEAQEVN